jgi:hypothetical protein
MSEDRGAGACNRLRDRGCTASQIAAFENVRMRHRNLPASGTLIFGLAGAGDIRAPRRIWRELSMPFAKSTNATGKPTDDRKGLRQATRGPARPAFPESGGRRMNA